MAGAEVAQTPTLGLGLVPVKLVQLFLDPCYLSLCEISDYETGGGAGTNLDFWSLPLAIQLPALFLLPLSIIGTGWLVVRAVRHRARTSGGRELRLLVEMTVAATGLTLGYVASSLTGPSHLRYGFARDFLLASLLAAVVIVVLASIAGWHLVARRRGGLLSPDAAFVVGAVVSAVLVVVGSDVRQVSRSPAVRKQAPRASRLYGELRGGRVRRSGCGDGSGRRADRHSRSLHADVRLRKR